MPSPDECDAAGTDLCSRVLMRYTVQLASSTSACTSCSQIPSNTCVRAMMLHCLPAIPVSVRLLVEVHLRNLLERHAHIRHHIKQCHHSCLTDGRDELHFCFQNFVHSNHIDALSRSSQLRWHHFGDGLATSLLCCGGSSDLHPVFALY